MHFIGLLWPLCLHILIIARTEHFPVATIWHGDFSFLSLWQVTDSSNFCKLHILLFKRSKNENFMFLVRETPKFPVRYCTLSITSQTADLKSVMLYAQKCYVVRIVRKWQCPSTWMSCFAPGFYRKIMMI